jgi:hypothetical protein
MVVATFERVRILLQFPLAAAIRHILVEVIDINAASKYELHLHTTFDFLDHPKFQGHCTSTAASIEYDPAT